MNNFRLKLESAGPLLGCVVTYPCPGIIERLRADWDWFWIDGQHGELGYQDMLALVRACDLAGCASMVRVPSHDPGWIGMALDMHCSGVIVPQIEDADEARAAVRAAKFPPLGNRSCGGRRPVDIQGREYAAAANRETILMLQLESPAALARAESIAAVEGVDCLLIGPSDVKLRMGFAMTDPRPPADEMTEIEALAQICRKHGKLIGVFGAVKEQLAFCVSLGVNLVVNGNDAWFLTEGSRRLSDESRKIIKEQCR